MSFDVGEMDFIMLTLELGRTVVTESEAICFGAFIFIGIASHPINAVLGEPTRNTDTGTL